MDSVTIPETTTSTVEIRESLAYRLRWWTLLVMAITSLLISVNGFTLNVALPTIQSKLNATSSELQWMVNIYLLVMSGLTLTLSALSDRLGRAKFLRAGLLIFGLASLGAMFSTAAMHIIIARAFMGLAAAVMMPVTLSIIANSFPKEERVRAIGICAGLSGCGIALGPIIAGTILQHLNWEWIFSINIPIVLLALILSVFLVPDSRDANTVRLDIPGNTLFLVGMTMLVYGLNTASSDGWSDSIVLGTIIGSLVVMTFFVLWERHTENPLLNMNFFKNIRFSVSLTLMTIFAFGFFGIVYILTFYMQFVKGYGVFQTGMRYLPLAIGFLMGSIVSSRLVDRLGIKAITFMSCLFGAIMLMFIAFFSVATPFWHFGIVLFFLGFFIGGIAAPASNMLVGSLPMDKAGISSGVNTIASYTPGSLSVAALGSLLTTVYSSHFQKAVASVQGLPTVLLDKASDSVGAAVGIANSGRVPPNIATPIVEAARHSFMDGWHIVAIVLCAVFVVGAAVSILFAPGRNA